MADMICDFSCSCVYLLVVTYKGFYRGRLQQGPKGRAVRPEGKKAGQSFGEEVASPSPPARGLGEHCKLPQRGPVQYRRSVYIRSLCIALDPAGGAYRG